MTQQEEIKKLITAHYQRLQILKEIKAKKGFNTPPEIIIEIEDIEDELAELKRELDELPRIVYRNPYRGLSAFQEKDADFFFGRDSFKEHLFDRVMNNPLVAVLGSSGSGKSSIVLAGLVPILRSDSSPWLITNFRPGKDPFRALASVLLPLYETDLDETDQMLEIQKLTNYLREGDLSLYEIVPKIFEKQSKYSDFLLIADQFEELYTHVPQSKLRERFWDVLLTAIDDNDDNRSRFHAILTLRADFLNQAIKYRPVANLLQQADIWLGPMTKDELREVIKEPAATQGVSFERGLVERILTDISHQPGNLPLLEFALTTLWEQQTQGQMTHAAYEAIGKVEGALSRHAEDVFSKLSTEEKTLARRIFVQMVQPGKGTEDTRRLATKADLRDDGWKLTQKLAGEPARLVVTGRDPNGHETAEVVHEALITHWHSFRDWMDEDRVFRDWQEQLRASLRQYTILNKDEGSLLRGSALALATEHLNERSGELGDEEREFIQASMALQELEVAEKDAQRQRELERKRSLVRWAVVAAIISLTLAIVAGITSWQARENAEVAERNAAEAEAAKADAEAEAKRARTAERQARASLLGVMSRGQFEKNPLLALRLAMEAWELSPEEDLVTRTNLEETVRAFVRTGRLLKFDHRVENINAFANSVFVIQSEIGADHIYLPDRQETLALRGKVKEVYTDPTSASFLISYVDAPDELWFKEMDRIVPLPAKVSEASFGPNGTLLEILYEPSSIDMWKQSADQFVSFSGPVSRVIFSPDGDCLVIDYTEKLDELWDGSTERIATLPKDVEWIRFSPDGAYLLIRYVNSSTRELRNCKNGRIMNLSDRISWDGVTFSDDGAYFVVDYSNAPDELRQSKSGLTISLLSGEVKSVRFSQDNTFFIVDYDDAVGEIRRSSNGNVVASLSGGIANTTLSPQGNYFVVDYVDNLDELRQSKTGLTTPLNGEVERVTFSPAGNYVIVDYTDRLGELLLSDTGEVVASLSGETSNIYFSSDGMYTLVDYENTVGELRRNDIGDVVSLADEIESAIFSSDGSQLVIDYENEPDELLQLASGRMIPLSGEITKMDFDSDETHLIINYSNTASELRNVDTAEIIVGGGDEVSHNGITLSPQENYLVIDYLNAPGQLYHIRTGDIVGLSDNISHRGVFFSPDESYCVVTYNNKFDELRDCLSGEQIATFENEIRDVFFSSNETYLIVDYQESPGELWDLKNNKNYSLLGKVERVIFSPDESSVLIDYENVPDEIWQTNEGRLSVSLSAGVDEVNFSPSGNLLSIKYLAQPRELWETTSGNVLSFPNDGLDISYSAEGIYLVIDYDSYNVPDELRNGSTGAKTPMSGELEEITFNTTKDLMVIDYKNTSGELWDETVAEFTSLSGEISRYGVNFSPSGKYLIVDYANVADEVWDLKEKSSVQFSRSIWNSTFSPEENYLVVSYSDDDPDELWDMATGMSTPLSDEVERTHFSSKENYLVVDYRDSPDELRDMIEGTSIPLSGEVESIHFSPKERYLVIDYKVRTDEFLVLDTEKVFPLSGEVEKIQFSPDETFTIVGYADAPDELMQSGDKIASLSGRFLNVIFSPDETYFLIDYSDASDELRLSSKDKFESLAGEISYDGVTFSHDGNYIVIDYSYTESQLFQRTSNDTLPKLVKDKYQIKIPDSGPIIVDFDGASGQLWSTVSNQVVTLPGEVSTVTSSPNGDYVVIRYLDVPTELRLSNTGELLEEFIDDVTQVTFSPNGQYILVDYENQLDELQRSASGKILTSFTREISSISFRDDAAYFVTNYQDGTAELWQGTPKFGKLTELGLGLAGHRFDSNNNLFVWHGDGRSYLLSLDWLAEMGGETDKFNIEELIQLSCKGPFSRKWLDGSVLRETLGYDEIVSCR